MPSVLWLGYILKFNAALFFVTALRSLEYLRHLGIFKCLYIFRLYFDDFWGCYMEYWACLPQVILVTRNSSSLSVPALVSHPLSPGGAVTLHHWSKSASLNIELWTLASISCGASFSHQIEGALALLCSIFCRVSSWLARYNLTDVGGICWAWVCE